MTTSEAAAIVGVHRATIWNAIQQGHIPRKLIGNSSALDPKDVAIFRDNYLRLKVTSTSATPAKKGRPLGSKNLHRVVVEPAAPADFVAEIIAERTRENPEFPGLLAGAEARRVAPLDFNVHAPLLVKAPAEEPPASSVTNCSACSKEILDTEVQMCSECGEDGLGE